MASVHDDDASDELAPRHILEVLTVPELSADFTDRVMGGLMPPRIERRVIDRSRLPWLVAGVSTCAAAVAIALLIRPSAVAPPVPPVSAPQVAAPVEHVASVEHTAVVDRAPVESPRRGNVVLAITPADATVRIDGRLVVGPSPFVITNLVTGVHAIEVEHDGFEPWVREIDGPDVTLELSIVLQPRAAAPELVPDIAAFVPSKAKSKPAAVSAPSPDGAVSMLRVGTDPGSAPAVISLDGKRIGTTPVVNTKVTPGKHRVKWEWPDGRVVQKTVDFVAGHMHTLRAGPT